MVRMLLMVVLLMVLHLVLLVVKTLIWNTVITTLMLNACFQLNNLFLNLYKLLDRICLLRLAITGCSLNMELRSLSMHLQVLGFKKINKKGLIINNYGY